MCIRDSSNTLVDGYKLNDILRIILETMYRAMGFKHVILGIKDARANTMQGRFGFGPDASELAKKFRFPLTPAQDVFYAATAKGVDLMISDIDDPKIAARIPDWYRKALSAKTFTLFPPVSYTHLDVYKRQAENDAIGGSNDRLQWVVERAGDGRHAGTPVR